MILGLIKILNLKLAKDVYQIFSMGKNTSNPDHGSQMSNLLGIVPYQRLRLLRILTLDLWMTKERKKRREDQL